MTSKTGITEDQFIFLTTLQSGYLELFEKNDGLINTKGMYNDRLNFRRNMTCNILKNINIRVLYNLEIHIQCYRTFFICYLNR